MREPIENDRIRSNGKVDVPWIITVLLFTSIYINRMSSFGSFILIGLTLLMLLYLLMTSDRHDQIKVGFFHFYLFGFSVYCMISSIWALNADDSISKGITLFEIMICLSVFFVYYSRERFGVDKLLRAVMWTGYIVSLYTFFDYGLRTIIDLLRNGDRLISSFNNVNEIAGLCVLAIVITVFFWLEEGFSWSYLFVLPSFFLLIVCGSRRGVISFVVCVSMILFLKLFSKREKIKSKGKIIAVCGILVLGLVALAKTSVFASLFERMRYLISSFTGSGDVDHSTSIRKDLIEYGFQVFQSHPLLGIGIGCTHILVSQRFGADYYLHNNFVELLAGGGIIGFLLFYSIHAVVLFSIFKHGGISRSRNRIVLAILALLLITDIASGSYYSKETFFLLMLCYLHASQIKRQIGSDPTEEEMK